MDINTIYHFCIAVASLRGYFEIQLSLSMRYCHCQHLSFIRSAIFRFVMGAREPPVFSDPH